MIIEEAAFREALRRVVKGLVVIVALTILSAVVGSFHDVGVSFRGQPLTAWIAVVISLIVAGFLLTLYRPVATVVTFYLTVVAKVGKLPGRDQYLGNLAAVAANLTFLAFFVAIYEYLLPVIEQCNLAFLHVKSLTTILNVLALLAVIAILLVLWKNANPVIDLLTGHISDKVSTVSSGLAYVNCPACQARNDRDAAFCVSCGADLKNKAAAAPLPTTGCPRCAADNPPSAKFCHKCGSPMP